MGGSSSKTKETTPLSENDVTGAVQKAVEKNDFKSCNKKE